MKNKLTKSSKPYVSMRLSEFLPMKKYNPDDISRITKKLLICIKTNE